MHPRTADGWCGYHSGVSGGTVALILGIYTRLITAISHVDSQLLAHLRDRAWRQAARHIDLRFLIALGIGIGVGIVSLGSLMHLLLEDYRPQTLSLFFWTDCRLEPDRRPPRATLELGRYPPGYFWSLRRRLRRYRR